MICPRRIEDGADRPPFLVDGPPEGPDDYVIRDGLLICTYCGSVEGSQFLDAARRGVKLGPTDKSYKVYVSDLNGKFYFQHLDQEQRQDFIDMHNAGILNIGYPGYFYVTPFFATRVLESVEVADWE